MRKKKYLPLYYKWAKLGQIPTWGLCNAFSYDYDTNSYDDLFRLIKPLDSDPSWSHDSLGGGYWGYDGNPFSSTDINRGFTKGCVERGIVETEAAFGFTPLRQTIVLFLAAMNDEL